ncbi:CBS domain-containing protein CBSCBSPB1-like protein [Tanacetum coccineum]
MALTSSSQKKKVIVPDRRSHSLSISRSMGLTGERTVKRLRLSKALTVPETTSIYEACRRMAARKVDALLVTDSNSLLCGIFTDKDIATRVIAREIDFENTPVSKVMTRNPVFVLADTLAVEALQKMVQGKFRHLPVVEHGQVIALLDIEKCLYDAIARMERAAEKGKAIAAAVEGVEKHWGSSVSGSNTFVESLRQRMFRPSLSTIISENLKLVTVSPSDTVVTATKKMLECHTSSAVATIDNKPVGILTSKDILMRVIAQDLRPELILVEKVMTPNPECATLDTPILNALQNMHDGKYLHLPVVDNEGAVVAIVDVLHITHAAVATVGNTAGIDNEAASSMMQKFWDTAMATSPVAEDDETRSENSFRYINDAESVKSMPYPSSTLPNTFGFKIQDRRGHTRSLADLITAILQRVGGEIDRRNLPQIMYEDEDKDKVVLATDSDLAAAVEYARLSGWKGLKLHLDYSGIPKRRKGSSTEAGSLDYVQRDAWTTAYSSVAAGAALVAGLGMVPRVLVTCRSKLRLLKIVKEKVTGTRREELFRQSCFGWVLDQNDWTENCILIHFMLEEFCLVTGLRFGVENLADYDDVESRIPFRTHVFPSYLDVEPITGNMVFKIIDDELFDRLHDDDAVSLCCLGILQLVLLGVEGKRRIPDWLLRLANDRGNLPVERLTPDETEARSDWWISSRAYFNGRIGQAE